MMDNKLMINSNWQLCADLFRLDSVNGYIKLEPRNGLLEYYKLNIERVANVINKISDIFSSVTGYNIQENKLSIGFTNGSPVTLNKETANAEILININNSNKPANDATIAYQMAHEMLHFSIKNKFIENYKLAFIQEIFACLSSLICLQNSEYYDEYREYFDFKIEEGKKYCNDCISECIKQKSDINNGRYGFYTYCAQKLVPIASKGKDFWDTLLLTSNIADKEIDEYDAFFKEWYNIAAFESQKEIIKLIANKLEAIIDVNI